jgi:hypothetical protein
MKAETESKKASKRKHVLVDVIVTADLSGMCWPNYPTNCTLEQWANYLVTATGAFHDFLRDHRSQDMVRLQVERKYADLCSVCGKEWETDYEGDTKICANCCAELIEENG